MFRGILDRLAAVTRGKRAQREPFVVPAVDARPHPDATVDESLLALSRELSGLAQLPVSQAVKERGWAALQREMERHPVRVAAKAAGPSVTSAKGAGAPRPAHSRNWRWALGSAAAVVAVIATLVGTYSGGLLTTAGNGEHPSTITSVVSSDTTEPTTTVTTEGTTVSTTGPTTTVIQPSTTQGPNSTGTTGGTGTTQGGGTGTTSHPNTTSGPTGTTRPSVSTTTQPSTTTTGEQQYTSAEREGSARAAAIHLAEMVITGNTSGARQLVAAEAQMSLAQMVMSLNEPYGYRWTGSRLLADGTVRVTMEINDRVSNGSGELVETIKRFVIRVQVNEDEAVVTAINAG